MEYKCPLCGQPVSKSVFDDITGIWKARQKALDDIKKQRAKLNQKFKLEKKRLSKKLTEERKKFAQQRIAAIEKAVSAKTGQFERQIAKLKWKEAKVERLASLKIKQATQRAHADALKLAKCQLNKFKKNLHASVKEQLKAERVRGAQLERRKFEDLEKSFKSALGQMKTLKKDLQFRDVRIRELEKQIERQTTSQREGYLYENVLVRELRKRFPSDKIERTEGGRGGDILHTVILKCESVGLIVYECKRVKNYSHNHVKQAAKAKITRKADFAILVTNAMKKRTHGFFTEQGVLVVHATGVLPLATIIRGQIARIAEMKLGQQQRDKAVKLILQYIEGSEFANSMDAILQESIAVYNELKKEIKNHVIAWKKRRTTYEKIYEEASIVKSKSKALLSGEHQQKKETLPALVELPEAEESKQKVPIEVIIPVRKKRPI